MTEAVSHKQILDAIAQLRQDVKDDIAEIKSDNVSVWNAITKLNNEMATGRGAVKALVWIGSTLIGLGAMVAAVFNAFRH